MMSKPNLPSARNNPMYSTLKSTKHLPTFGKLPQTKPRKFKKDFMKSEILNPESKIETVQVSRSPERYQSSFKNDFTLDDNFRPVKRVGAAIY